MVFASCITGTILTIWLEQVQIVRANVVLGQIDNGRHERLFTVVVCRMLRNITNELSNLLVQLQIELLMYCERSLP
jgi:hypothetical protein